MTVGTIEGWIKFSQSIGWAGVIVKNNYYGLFIGSNQFTTYNWSSTGSTGATTAGSALNDNNWHHIAFSFNSGVSNGSFMYVDGALVKTLTWAGNNSTTNYFCVGSETANFNVFTGYVDEIRIWNFQLSAAFISANYNRKVVPSAQGLVGYFTFDTDPYTAGAITAGSTFNNIANRDITKLAAYGTGLSLSTTINTNISNYYNGFTAAGSAVSVPLTVDKLPNFSGIPALWAAYSAEKWVSATNVLPDLTGNGRDATTTGVTYGTASGNGASGTIAYLDGTTASKVDWPSGSIPSTFTICSLTRYTGGTSGRMFDGKSNNWLHSHWYGNAGVCHYDGWRTNSTTASSVSNVNNWLICTGTNSTSVASPYNVVVNNVDVGTANGGSGSNILSINNGSFTQSGEKSNFQFSQLFIWDSALTSAQMHTVNNFMQNYLNTGSSASISSYAVSSTNITSNLYPNSLGCIFRIKATTATMPTTDVDNVFTLTNTGSVTCVADPLGVRPEYVFRFNGSNYLSVAVNTPAICTKTFWLYTTNFTNNNNCFSSKVYPVYMLSNSVYIKASPGYPGFDCNSPIGQPASWTFYAITCNSTSVSIYMNGSATPVITSTLTTPYLGETASIYFGAYNSPPVGGFLDGYLDDMRLYPGILTPAQIQAIYLGDTSVMRNISSNAYQSAQGVYGTYLMNASYTGPVMQLRLPSDSGGAAVTDFFADIYGNLNTGPNNSGISLPTWASNPNTYLNSDPTLLMYYPFNSNLFNIVSGTVDATFVNGGYISNNDYKVGYGACQFLGITQYVTSTASFTTGSGAVSFSFWFRSNNSPTYARLFNFSSAYRTNTIFMGINAAGQLGCSVYNGTTYGDVWSPGTPAVNDNVWRHCLWVTNSTASNNSSIYLNGVRSVTFTINYPQAVARSVNYFGYNEFGNGLFVGAIDDFRVYNRAVNGNINYIQELAALYNYTGYSHAYITKWYDQSNLTSNHGYQTVTGSQPVFDFLTSTVNFGYSGLNGCGLGYVGNYNNNAFLNLQNNALPYNDSSYTYVSKLFNVSANNTNAGIVSGGSNGVKNMIVILIYNGTIVNHAWYANDILSIVNFIPNSVISATYTSGSTRTIVVNGKVTSQNVSGRAQNNTSNYIGQYNEEGNVRGINGQMYFLYTFNASLALMDRTTVEATANPQRTWTPYLLNNLSNTGYNSCQGAYACILVNTQYKGPIMRLRSPNDTTGANATDFYSDIYGNLTTAPGGLGTPVMTWSSNPSFAYVVKWYDQSNVTTNHAIQSTVTSQPIYDIAFRVINFSYNVGGTSTSSTGYISTGNSTSFFNLPDGTVPYGNSSFTVTMKHFNISQTATNPIATASGSWLGSGPPLVTNQSNCFRINNTNYQNYWWASDMIAGTYAANNVVTFAYNNSTTNTVLYVNSANSSTLARTARASLSTQNTIGKDNYNDYLYGQLYYLYIFNTPLSTSDRNIIENTGYFPTNPNKLSVTVNNWNFAYPSVAANNAVYNTAISGWNISGSAGFVVANGASWGYSANSFSTQYFIIQQPINASIYQSIYLNAGTTYVAQFYASARPGTFSWVTTITMTVTINGFQIFSQVFTYTMTTWVLYTSTPFVMNYNGYYTMSLNYNETGSGDSSVGTGNVVIVNYYAPTATSATASVTSSQLVVTVNGANLAYYTWKNNVTNTTGFVTCSNNSGSFTDTTSITGSTDYTYTIAPINSSCLTGSNYTTNTFRTNASYYNGVVYTIYDGYKNNDTTVSGWALYNAGNLYNSGQVTGRTTNLTNIGWGTNGAMIGNQGGGSNWNGISFNGDRHYFTIVWAGLLYTQSYAGNWTFSTNSDDASFLWVGNNAVSPNYTGGRSTATVDNGDAHGMVYRSATVNLSANTYYPFRVQFGEQGGGYDCYTIITRPDGTALGNATGYLFSQ
jgi:hypothetical protein